MIRIAQQGRSPWLVDGHLWLTETRAALASLQREKAVGAASRIEQYLRQLTQQLQGLIAGTGEVADDADEVVVAGTGEAVAQYRI